MAKGYLTWARLVASRAARDSYQGALNWGPILGVAVLGGAAHNQGLAVTFPPGFQGDASSAALYAVVAWCALFLMRLVFVAPYQVWSNERRTVAALKEKLETDALQLRLIEAQEEQTSELKRQREAVERERDPVYRSFEAHRATLAQRYLRLEFEAGSGFESHDGHRNDSWRHALNVRLRNASRNMTVSDCAVRITDINPSTGNVLPRTLKEGISLAGGDSLFIPLVACTELFDGEKFTTANTMFDVLVGEYPPVVISAKAQTMITLRATGIGTTYEEATFKVWVERGELKMEPAGNVAREAS